MKFFDMNESKFFLAAIIIIFGSLALVAPAIVNIVLGTTMILLTGSEYVSLVIGIYGIYCGLHVAEQHVLGRLEIDGNSNTSTEPATKDAKEPTGDA